MPVKLNHDRRCHIPRQKHRVINSAAYDAALRQRGSLTAWFTDAAIEDWHCRARPHGVAKGVRLHDAGTSRGSGRTVQAGDGDRLRLRTDDRRATELDIAVHAPNRMTELGRPNYVRTA